MLLLARMRARLLQGPEPGGFLNKAALREFLIHGVKYAFPRQRGEVTRGIPTAHAAEPLKRQISAGNEPPPVWPSAMGKTRGYSFCAAVQDRSPGGLTRPLSLSDARLT